jgi:Zn finger protein HypA/HybF involved in hydrogenase expression
MKVTVVELSTSIMMIKCRDCGHEHPSDIQMDTSDFKSAKIHNKSEQCPKCGSVSTYKKSDYFFL